MKAIKTGGGKKFDQAKGEVRVKYIYELIDMTADEKAKYKASKQIDGHDYYRETSNGNPLWFTDKALPPVLTMRFAQVSGKLYADTSELDMLQSLAGQYKGPLGNALANACANTIISKVMGTTPASEPVNEPAPDKQVAGLEE